VPWNVESRPIRHTVLTPIVSQLATVPVAVDSSQRLVSAGPTTAEFLGYVSDVTIDVQTNEIVRGSLIVQRSGAIAWDWPTVTQ